MKFDDRQLHQSHYYIERAMQYPRAVLRQTAYALKLGREEMKALRGMLRGHVPMSIGIPEMLRMLEDRRNGVNTIAQAAATAAMCVNLSSRDATRLLSSIRRTHASISKTHRVLMMRCDQLATGEGR